MALPMALTIVYSTIGQSEARIVSICWLSSDWRGRLDFTSHTESL